MATYAREVTDQVEFAKLDEAKEIGIHKVSTCDVIVNGVFIGYGVVVELDQTKHRDKVRVNE